MSRLLVTFGCSWAYGVGVGYTQGMTIDEYTEVGWQEPVCDRLSFRGVLAQRHNFVKKNFSEPGSSNQRQFRLAKEYFVSDEFKQAEQEYDSVQVLWGITSTSRNELFLLSEKKLVTFFYTSDTPESRAMVKHFYDHDNEVKQLATEMLFWNDYFAGKNINNVWFDTFNHYNYPVDIDRLIDNNNKPRDLLSKLAVINGLATPDSRYHASEWSIDSNRVKYLIDCGVLNPYSHHPTALGHKQIADILSPYIQ